ncbi:MAG: ComF family protein [Rhodospirillales bacterium]|nr:ComF family protein [Rhodospirillales bacterium]
MEGFESNRAALRQLAGAALDILFPPQCMNCRAPVVAAGTLCASCWSAVSFIAEPYCDACGLPFDLPLEGAVLCGGCIAHRPAFDRARAVFRYDAAARPMILGFKHGDATEHAPAFAEWMARAGGDLLDTADLIVPVPLHWSRLFRRRYNQAALLAHALGGLSGLPVIPDLLVRHRRTPPLGRMSPDARRRVLGGAIDLRRQGDVSGKRVLLVDDVMTTGTTVSACAKVMRRGGAEGVDVITLARVVRTD